MLCGLGAGIALLAADKSFMMAFLAAWIGVNLQSVIDWPRTFTWANPDATNRHDFRPASPRKAAPTGLGRAKFDDLKRRFETTIVEDPNVGPIRCSFADSLLRGEVGGKAVFEVRRITDDSQIALLDANPNTAGMRLQILADPALHPDTVERLVETFAISFDSWQVYGHMLALEKARLAAKQDDP
ncbi:MAG: hypothetical protein HONBIEJF_01409 [Fimbriimonadaceae bacterium]|nr:hypothetical protein [Fimbriimonadaceae bacterium]